MPETAIPSPGIFYPGNLLFAFFPFSTSLALNMLLSQLVAGAGAYCFIASLGWGALAAACAGFIVSMTSYMFCLESNYTLVGAFAWLIMVFAALKKMEAGESGRKFFFYAGASFSFFAFLTAGRPEIIAPGLALISFYFLHTGWQIWKGKKDITMLFQQMWLPLLSLTIGALLSLPQVLPALEWLPLSRRGSGLDSQETFLFSSGWFDLICLILIAPLGDLQLRWAKFLPVASSSNLVPFVASAYIGPVALTLALLGASDRSWAGRAGNLFFLLAGLLLALGDNTPVAPFLLKVFPFLGLIRFPSKLLIFLIAAMAIFAARGACTASDRQSRPALWLPVLFWLICLQAAFAALSIAGLLQHLPAVQAAPDLVGEAQILLGQSLLAASLVGLGACAIVFLCRRQLLKPALLKAILLIGLCGNMLASAYACAKHTTGSDFFKRDSLIATAIENLAAADNSAAQGDLKEETGGILPVRPRVAGLYLENFTCPLWLQPQDPSAGTAAWAQYQRQMLCPNTNMDFHLPATHGFESSMCQDYFNSFIAAYLSSRQSGSIDSSRALWPEAVAERIAKTKSDLPLSRFLRLTATRYAITQVYKYAYSGSPPVNIPLLDPSLFKLELEDPRLNVRIFKVLNTLPRAYTTCSWQWSSDHAGALDRLYGASAETGEPSLTTLLEESNRDKMREPAAKLLPGSVAEKLSKLSCVKFISDTNEEIALAVSNNSNNKICLVLADQFYPGWQAQIDGKAVAIHRANGFFRAVFVEPGHHTVEFFFRPASLLAGLILAGSGLCLLFLLAGYLNFRRKPQ